jgi:hypothetical protein
MAVGNCIDISDDGSLAMNISSITKKDYSYEPHLYAFWSLKPQTATRVISASHLESPLSSTKTTAPVIPTPATQQFVEAQSSDAPRNHTPSTPEKYPFQYRNSETVLRGYSNIGCKVYEETYTYQRIAFFGMKEMDGVHGRLKAAIISGEQMIKFAVGGHQ